MSAFSGCVLRRNEMPCMAAQIEGGPFADHVGIQRLRVGPERDALYGGSFTTKGCDHKTPIRTSLPCKTARCASRSACMLPRSAPWSECPGLSILVGSEPHEMCALL